MWQHKRCGRGDGERTLWPWAMTEPNNDKPRLSPHPHPPRDMAAPMLATHRIPAVRATLVDSDDDNLHSREAAMLDPEFAPSDEDAPGSPDSGLPIPTNGVSLAAGRYTRDVSAHVYFFP